MGRNGHLLVYVPLTMHGIVVSCACIFRWCTIRTITHQWIDRIASTSYRVCIMVDEKHYIMLLNLTHAQFTPNWTDICTVCDTWMRSLLHSGWLLSSEQSYWFLIGRCLPVCRSYFSARRGYPLFPMTYIISWNMCARPCDGHGVSSADILRQMAPFQWKMYPVSQIPQISSQN